MRSYKPLASENINTIISKDDTVTQTPRGFIFVYTVAVATEESFLFRSSAYPLFRSYRLAQLASYI